jgi:hypothetical protein
LSRRPHLNGRAGALAGIAFYIIIINGDAIYSSLAQGFSQSRVFQKPCLLFGFYQLSYSLVQLKLQLALLPFSSASSKIV